MFFEFSRELRIASLRRRIALFSIRFTGFATGLGLLAFAYEPPNSCTDALEALPYLADTPTQPSANSVECPTQLLPNSSLLQDWNSLERRRNRTDCDATQTMDWILRRCASSARRASRKPIALTIGLHLFSFQDCEFPVAESSYPISHQPD